MRFSSFLKYGIILILFPAVYIGFFSGQIVLVQTLCWGMYMYLFARKWRDVYVQRNNFDVCPFFLIYLLYAVITYIRGWFNIDWMPDFYNMFGGLLVASFLLPFLLFMGSPYNIKFLWRSFMTWGILLCIINFFFPPSDEMRSFAHNMSFFNVFILCIPFIKKKYWVLIPIAVLITIFYDLNRRSILINNLIPFFILAFSYSFIRTVFARRILISSLILTPIILFLLGAVGVFNIFKYAESVSDYSIGRSIRNITTDSRTGIYMDVLSEIHRQKAYLWGLGGNGKTPSHLQEKGYGEIYKFGRPSTESGMLNHIQYGGLLGLIAYSLLFIVAAFKASGANNDFIGMLGIFIAFRFLYSFVEDQITNNAQTFYLFLWISMCYNKQFREMSNVQIKRYFRLIFK